MRTIPYMEARLGGAQWVSVVLLNKSIRGIRMEREGSRTGKLTSHNSKEGNVIGNEDIFAARRLREETKDELAVLDNSLLFCPFFISCFVGLRDPLPRSQIRM